MRNNIGALCMVFLANLVGPAVAQEIKKIRLAIRMIDANIYNRDSLGPGFAGSGPAGIEEYGSTTVVWPGDRFEIGASREIRIHCAQE